MGPKPLLVLFVSTGNAARSQMAEALLNAKNSDYYRARSAGIAPAEALAPQAIALLENAGCAVSRLHPKRWEDFFTAADYVPVDVIVTLSPESRPIAELPWPGNPVCVHWVVDDPLGALRHEQRDWKFRKCFATLDARINALVRARPATSPCEALLRFKEVGAMV